jgi:uncharacterized protein YdaU (DUF1376 family)
MKLPYQKVYWGDYFAKTTTLLALERGAYLMLIGRYWINGGPLPDDNKQLALLVMVSLEDPLGDWLKLRPKIEPLFRIEGGFWHHDRIDEDWAKAEKEYENHVAGADKTNAKRREKKTHSAAQSDSLSVSHSATLSESQGATQSEPAPAPTSESYSELLSQRAVHSAPPRAFPENDDEAVANAPTELQQHREWIVEEFHRASAIGGCLMRNGIAEPIQSWPGFLRSAWQCKARREAGQADNELPTVTTGYYPSQNDVLRAGLHDGKRFIPGDFCKAFYKLATLHGRWNSWQKDLFALWDHFQNSWINVPTGYRNAQLELCFKALD